MGDKRERWKSYKLKKHSSKWIKSIIVIVTSVYLTWVALAECCSEPAQELAAIIVVQSSYPTVKCSTNWNWGHRCKSFFPFLIGAPLRGQQAMHCIWNGPAMVWQMVDAQSDFCFELVGDSIVNGIVRKSNNSVFVCSNYWTIFSIWNFLFRLGTTNKW